MSKPLLIQVIPTLGGGGAEREVARVSRALNDRSPFEVEVCCLMGRGGFADGLEKHGVKVVVLSDTKRSQYTNFSELIRYLRLRKPTIVHVHLLRWGAIAAKMAGVPVVFSSEHNWVPGRTTYEAVLGAMNAFCTDRIVGVAEAVSTQLKGWCGIPRNKVVTVANAIEMDGFADGFDEAEKRRELGIPFDCSIIGNIARLTGQKAQRYFIDSAAIILERNAKCEFLIVGEGELRAELEEYTRTLGVTEHVRFLGFRDDVREIMRLLDVLCLSSIHEGTPITLLEGMACEKPVVSTDVGGCREVVVDGETGFLVQPRDPQALAEALLRLVDDKDLAVRMGQAGLRRVREVYSEDANLSVLNNLYQAVMTEKHLVTEPK